MSQDRSRETRAIYHQQHSRIAADERAMRRFIGMFSYEYFGLPEGWFAGKSALDAGCGSTAKLLIALHGMGCRDLHGFDLDTDFIPTAQQALAQHGATAELRSGSVLEIPYPDATFDFVSCHGVLVHLNELAEVPRAFAELARVTKPGGLLYTVFGVAGGVLEDAIFPAVREHYRRDPAFKLFVDNIKPSDLHGIAGMMGLPKLLDLLDTDLCVTIQNVIQAPVRLRIDEAMIRGMYAEAGFEEPRRLRRFVKRENIRKFFAPLHYATPDEPILQLIYGSGNLEFIARKS